MLRLEIIECSALKFWVKILLMVTYFLHNFLGSFGLDLTRNKCEPCLTFKSTVLVFCVIELLK